MVIVINLSLDNLGGVVYQDFRKLMDFIAALYWAFPGEELRSRAIHSIRELPCGVRLPWWLSGKEHACQCRRCGFNSWVGKIPWRRKEMATHSSIFAWEIPWTEALVRLQSMGPKRVRHNLATEQQDNFHKMNKLCLLKLIECTIHSESKLWILVRYVVWAKTKTKKKKPCSF